MLLKPVSIVPDFHCNGCPSTITESKLCKVVSAMLYLIVVCDQELHQI